tara:strand:+ start:1498 stop:2616 length:1119 start_codon:yes stop_codon:yes gene_type:complete
VLGLIDAPVGSNVATIKLVFQPFLVGGVDLFFVLSGFLISGILMDNKQATNYFRTFWTRRIGRIFPVYYLMIFLLIVLYLIDCVHETPLVSSLLKGQMPIWAYATFTQNFYLVFNGVFGNFLGVTWSLAMEEQFYLMLPFLVYFLPRRYLVRVCIAAILLAPVIRWILWELISWRATYHLTPARMDTIMWGVLIACTIRHEGVMAVLTKYRSAINVLIVVLAVAVGANLFGYLSDPLLAKAGYHSHGLFVSTLRYSALAMMYGLLVLRLHLPGATLYRSAMEARWLGHVGVLSYAVYMYHQLFNLVVHRLVHDSLPHIAGWHEAYIPVIVLSLTFIAAELSYRFMERPILNRVRRTKYQFADELNTRAYSTA